MVHLGERGLVLRVSGTTDTSDEESSPVSTGEIHDPPIGGCTFDALKMSGGLTDHRQTLVDAEQRLLGGSSELPRQVEIETALSANMT